MAILGLAAVLLFGAGVAAAVTHRDDDGDPVEQAGVTTSSTVADTTTTVADTTTVPATSTTVAPGTTSTTARAATTTTTARAGATTTTRRPASTTVAPGATPDCTAAQIEVTAMTDKSSYVEGQQVKVDSTLRNRSTTTCYYTGHTFGVTIVDAAGKAINSFNIVTPGPTKSAFVPGATLSGSVPWDQFSCGAPPCLLPPRGAYAAAVTWIFAGGPYEARAPFLLS